MGFTFKKTVISTTAHGIPFTLINNEYSILVNPDDFNELANVVFDLLKNMMI